MSQQTTYQLPLVGYASLSDFQTASLTRRVRRMIGRWATRALIGFGLLIAFVTLFSLFGIGPFTAVLGVMACLLSTAVAAGCLRSAREQRAMLVLSYCEQGVRLSAPLPEFLRAVAMNESRNVSRRLVSISDTLQAPASLGGAIVSELPELPLRIGELLRAAESSGTLAPTLTRIVQEQKPQNADESASGPLNATYVAITLLAVALPAIFIAIFVMPKLAEIAKDFGMPLPWSWSAIRALGPDTFLAILAAVFFVALVILFFVLISNVQGIFFRRREYDRPFKAVVDNVLWRLPFFGAGVRDRDWADVCQSIADGLNHQRPMDVMLREAASVQHLSAVTATRLDRWMIGVLRGQPLAKAARASRVPGPIAGLIGEGSLTADSLAPVFAFLARHYQGRHAQRSAWLRAAALPALTLVSGAIVAGFGLFLWVPLTRLIEAVAPYPTRL